MTKQLSGPRCSLPLMVNPDFNMKPDTKVDGWDSWFVTANVEAGGHEFGLLVHGVRTMATPTECKTLATAKLTDLTAKRYATHETAAARFSATDNGFSLQGDGFNWSGDSREMKALVRLDEGSSLDITLRPHGFVLPYNSTGLIPMFGGQYPNYQYAFPHIEITGTLELDGIKSVIEKGNAWFDRQWAPLPTSGRWLWMSVNLSNGDAIGLWETDMEERFAWATVLHADGSVTVAETHSLFDNATAFWKGEMTGISYPSEWRMVIPALGADLKVIAQPPFTDIVNIPRLEEVIHVSGTYQGKETDGRGYVEMIDTGLFKTFIE